MSLKYLLASTLGLFLGILFAYEVNFSTQVFVVSFVISLTNFLILKFQKPTTYKIKNETSIFLTLFFLFISLGILLGQYNLAQKISRSEAFQDFISQRESFTGIVKEVGQTENSTYLILNLKGEQNYKVKIITAKSQKYMAGDILSFKGQIVSGNVLLPETKEKLNKSFNTEIKNSLHGIEGEVAFPKIETLGRETNFFYTFKNSKNKFVNILNETSPKIVASLSAGATLGEAYLFPQTDLENFRYAGLSHLIVLSGFNITIVILFFGIIFLALNLKLKLRIFLSLLTIIIFIIFVGGEPSIVRAGIMGSLLLLANLFGKQYVAKQGLFLSAFGMLLFNPAIAPYDISFHLSFLATFAILYGLPILDNYKIWQTQNLHSKFFRNTIEIFKITLVIQILILPYLAFTFQKISTLGILSNILVVPVIPIIMLLTLLIIIFYYIFAPLSVLFGYLSYFFCKYIFLVASQVAHFSISKIPTQISLYTLIIIYALIFFLIYFEEERYRLQKYLKNN